LSGKQKSAANKADSINNRKQAEAAIRKAEAIYGASVDNASVSILFADDKGKLLEVNKKAEELAGYARQELLGMSLAQLYPKEELERITRASESGFERKIWYVGNTLVLQKGGKVIPVDVIGNILEHTDRRLSQIMIFNDEERKRAKEILSESEERYKSIINGAAEGFWLINPQLETIGVNESLCKMLGYSREEMLGKKPFDFADEENRKIFKEQTSRIPGTSHRHYNIVLKSKAGNDVYTRFNATTARDNSGNTISAFAFVTDITELKLTENSLLESKERMEQLYKVIPSAIFTVDTAHTILSFNRTAEEITGYVASEVIGKKCSILSLDTCAKECALFAGNSAKPIIGKECTINRKDGERRVLSKNSDLLKDIYGNVIGGVESFEDITERKQDEEMLNYLAHYDALTGLPNRRLLYDNFAAEISRTRRNGAISAVLFLDLDNFKTINDTLGHPVGDQLLREVAVRLKKSLRSEDTVARLGGDEFTLLITETRRIQDVAKIAQKVIDEFKSPFSIGNREFYITTSAGIAVYPNDGKEVNTLLRNADIALYRAKEQGRNNYQFYTSAMGEKVLERLILENNLHKALEREEFLLHYQPIVNLNSGNIAGMEALLRWQHPDFGLVYPSDFIPILEETGLIVPVGEWVLRTACKQAMAWQDKSLLPIRIAVNLSAKQFRQENLVEMIGDVLDKTGLRPECLEIEVTENAVLKDMDQAVKTFQRLKELGVYISFDDFATGYSSLSLLRKLPADTLKIDRSFVCEITTSLRDAEIAKAVITLAHSLGMKAIAEGVETIDQLEFLRSLKCDEVQGYVFARPLPVYEAEALLAAEMRLCA